MTTTHFQTPILIIFWRRPDALTRLINRLRPLAPGQLFLACDGPRPDHKQEADLVEHTRELAERMIDWPCTIQTRYNTINQGCKYGPGHAIDWFFEQVEEGIILEDDCLPDLSFFAYCEALLERYRDDCRVWQISGTNFLASPLQESASYQFSTYTTTWGWATWKRCWHAYDITMASWPEVRNSGELALVFAHEDEQTYWTKIWDRLTQDDYPQAWDYQWNYVCFIHGGLSAVPNRNLVSNIGFGEGATHCFDANDPRAAMASGAINEIRHPRLVLRCQELDRAIFANVYLNQDRPKQRFLRRKALEALYTLKGITGKMKRYGS
ncbi:MAG: hypothetical protein ACKO45_11805 [Cyanobium sp.]